MTLIPVTDAARSIRNEYLAIPGLSLTRDQARRLYCLDPVVCDGVLAALVDVRFLEQREDGRYVRTDRASQAGGDTSERSGGRRFARFRAA